MPIEFSKEFYQKAWGDGGYYENFSYGVGIDRVCETSLYPFIHKKNVLEIGPGGGVFTERIIKRANHLTAIDVIKMPEQFKKFDHFKYIELSEGRFDCSGVESSSIDFCFSYNVFCHLSDIAIAFYLMAINRVLKDNCSVVFMLANFEHSKKHFPEDAHMYVRGDLLPIGHFYQDERTLNEVIHPEQWEVISANMIPEHRDIIIHLKKKPNAVFAE